jgi:enoyl-CoA hydratase
MSDPKALLIDRTGAVATLTINDPPRNPMGLDFMDELEAAIPELDAEVEVRALVIRGAGEAHFSVGMNLKQMGEGVRRKGGMEGVLDQRLRVLAAIEGMRKPVVAALSGYCLGGGLELALACHFRLAAEEGARIGLPELELGTLPAWGGTARLTRCVGRAHALDLILRAKKISASDALRIGLVHELWPDADLHARAQDLAEELAAMPAASVAGVLEAVVKYEHASLDEALAAERRGVLAAMATEDQREGMRAFLEKRKPVFNQG